ncbi:MAG: cysteine hydrolase family protein [Gemmatimonadota bacterium]|jgi:nicotinamidase-related amidase
MSLPTPTPGRTALLVVDVQNEAVRRGPYRGDRVLRNIARLIEVARAAGVEVIHVQHDEPPGEPGEPGTEPWEIHASVRPEPGEKRVRKRFNSAFRDTDLLAYLRQGGVGTLVLVGIQTEYCVDTTCRVAFEYGFRVILPEWTNTTYDNGDVPARQIHELFNRRIFAGRFAEVPPMEVAVRALQEAGG